MRTFVRPFEAAFVLQASEMQVRRMVDRDLLDLVGAGSGVDRRRTIRIDPESVLRVAGSDQSRELRRLVMRAILGSRVSVPRPSSRWGPPAPLRAVAGALNARGAVADCNKGNNLEPANAEPLREDSPLAVSCVAQSNKKVDQDQHDVTGGQLSA
jgi:hypothetical protein